MFDSFIFFPDDFSILVGNGLLPNDVVGKGTDVGYIQFIWNYGIIGLILLGAYFAYPIIYICKSRQKMVSNMAVALGIMIIIYMVKLNYFGYGMAAIVLTTIELCGMYDMRIQGQKMLSIEKKADMDCIMREIL